MIDIFHSLVQLVANLLTLFVEIGGLALRNLLIIAWVAWWLCAVRWTRAWAILAKGGWAVVVLLALVAALAWASIAPGSYNLLGAATLGNYWWQLGVVTLLILSALFCGWLQGVFGWEPDEIELVPAAHDQGHGEHHSH